MVKYNNLDMAIRQCGQFREGKLFWGKTDVQSAFRLVPLMVKFRKLLLVKAKDPRTGITKYFVEKNLPFGHNISCCIFQRFSNSLRHIVEMVTGAYNQLTNYLDEYLFVSDSKKDCDLLMAQFISICEDTGVPITHGQDRVGNQEDYLPCNNA